jgi:glycosyltransferase involved in cell wall biosynthesis
MATILSKISTKPAIFDMDSNLPEQLGTIGFIRKTWIQRLVERFYQWAASHSTLIITVCRALSVRARRIAPRVPVVQIEDIPLSEHGTCSSKGALRPVANETIKRRHGLDNGRVVLYTGNLEAYQGIDLMLSAWQWVRTHSSEQDAILVIVGGNPADIAKYRQNCRNLGIDEAVVWVGQRPAAEMESWMSLADILLSPRSQGYNTPLKLFSYMASGKPVVATRRETHTQIVNESEAFLAESHPTAFGRAIWYALANGEDAAGRARKASEKIRSQYNYDVFRTKLLVAYGHVLNDDRRHDAALGRETT